LYCPSSKCRVRFDLPLCSFLCLFRFQGKSPISRFLSPSRDRGLFLQRFILARPHHGNVTNDLLSNLKQVRWVPGLSTFCLPPSSTWGHGPDFSTKLFIRLFSSFPPSSFPFFFLSEMDSPGIAPRTCLTLLSHRIPRSGSPPLLSKYQVLFSPTLFPG